MTELPQEYRQLEERVDKVKAVHDMFLKVSRNYTLHAYDYEPALNEKVIDFANTVTTNATSLAEKLSGSQIGSQSKAVAMETPPSLSHAFAKAAYLSADIVGENEPYGAALKKFASAHERAGNARLQQDADAASQFHNPMLATMNYKIGEASKARRNVQNARLTYDACRSRLKSSSPERADALRTEMEKSEDEFVMAVDEAMGKMKLVVENSETLKLLGHLVTVQTQYHKTVYDILAELGPEIDELVVTNEALYSSGATGH